MQQYNLKSCLKSSGDKWKYAVSSELTKIHDMDNFALIDAINISIKDISEALMYLMILTLKGTTGSEDGREPMREINKRI